MKKYFIGKNTLLSITDDIFELSALWKVIQKGCKEAAAHLQISTLLQSMMPDDCLTWYFRQLSHTFPFFFLSFFPILFNIYSLKTYNIYSTCYRNFLNILIFQSPYINTKCSCLMIPLGPSLGENGSWSYTDGLTVAFVTLSQELLVNGHFWSVRLNALSLLKCFTGLPDCIRMAEWTGSGVGDIIILPPVSW